MTIGGRIFYNTLAQTLGKIFAAILGLVTVSLLSRYLREGGFGQYSTVVAFLGFFAVLADFGLYLFVVREISKKDATQLDRESILSNALGLRLALAAVLLAAGTLIAFLFPYEPIVKKTMFVGIAALLFVSLNQVLIGIFQKHLVQYLAVVSETVARLINFLLVYLFIKQGLSLPYFILALLAGNAANFFLTAFFARRFEKFGIAFDFRIWRKIIADSWPLVFAVILNLLYFKTDTVILSAFHPEEVVGVYSLPYKMLEGFLAFPAMFVGLLMPLLSRHAYADWPRFRQVLQNGFDALVLMVIPVLLISWFFAKDIINLLKGSTAFTDSPEVLKILSLAAAIIFFGTLFGYAVVAVNQQKSMIKGYFLGAFIGLVLYFLLIPPFRYFGAAWGTVISELAVAIYACVLVQKTAHEHLSLKILGRSLPAALAAILFFQLVGWLWLAEAAAGLVIYALVLILTGAIPRHFLKELWWTKTE